MTELDFIMVVTRKGYLTLLILILSSPSLPKLLQASIESMDKDYEVFLNMSIQCLICYSVLISHIPWFCFPYISLQEESLFVCR